VRLIEPASLGRVGLEIAAVTAALAVLAVVTGQAGPIQLVLVVAYAHAYGRWRRAPRVDLFPGAADAIAARS